VSRELDGPSRAMKGTSKGTYAVDDEVAERHFRAIEVEKVHEFGRLAAAQGVVVDPLGLVVELELDREHLDALCL